MGQAAMRDAKLGGKQDQVSPSSRGVHSLLCVS